MPRRLTIPDQLLKRLQGSPLEPGTLALADAVTEILRDNKTPFFEAYTDHATEHVERVIAACLRLIPTPVLDEGKFRSTDTAVLLGAALLHDLAMHVRQEGFVALVSPDTPFQPLPWFRDAREGRPADMPWPALWATFQREARKFGKSQLDALLGPRHHGVPAVAHAEHLDPASWREEDRLLIGEFLRRHHARLAHEIVVYGFPGGGNVVRLLPADVADAMGCVARSHGEPLRNGLAYVAYKYGADLRPSGALLPFLMALLRIADYLQLDAERAPAVLMHLKAPQSPKSIEEWERHAAVENIGWDGRDDRAAVRLHVSSDLTLRIYLALEDLVAALSAELDTAVATLDEHYGAVEGYRAIQLARRRVQTNLHSPALLDTLSFVPRRAAFTNADDLFRLMIWDLYGTEDRGVAGRELVQNAVDAVRERRLLEHRRGQTLDVTAFYDLGEDIDVLVTLEEQQDESWLLRVRDRGIGMTPDTVIDYYLRAGASYGSSADDSAPDAHGKDNVALKTGRFGIGAFATFLLSDEVTVTTRHMDEARAVRFERARLEDEVVELRTCNAPVGTEVVAPVELSYLDWDGDENTLLSHIEGFYRFADPVARFELRRKDGSVQEQIPYYSPVPHSNADLDPRWRALDIAGFDAVYWTWPRPLEFVHNGLMVYDFERGQEPASWCETHAKSAAVPFPTLSIIDTRELLDFPLHRYWVKDHRVPFERELLTAIGQDIVAYALVHGANGHPSGLQTVRHHTAGWFPALPELIARYCRGLLIVIAESYGPRDGAIAKSVARAVQQRLGDSAWTLAVTDSRTAHGLVNRLTDAVPVDCVEVARISAGPSPDPLEDILSEDGQLAAQDPAIAAVLEASLADVPDLPPAARVELSAYRLAVDSSPVNAPSPLAAPWLELIGDPLADDREARAALVDCVWHADPEVRPMIDAWRQTTHPTSGPRSGGHASS
jgi:molecular chaperone HtpG